MTLKIPGNWRDFHIIRMFISSWTANHYSLSTESVQGIKETACAIIQESSIDLKRMVFNLGGLIQQMVFFLLSFVLTQQILAYPRRHKITKHIQHETKAKDHPCRQSLEVRDRPFPILASLQELLIDVRKTKQHIACRTDPKSCSDKMLRKAKKRFTTFHVSALCGEEIMYDISLVLEHFYKEFMAINAELEYLYSNLILDANDQLKHLLAGTLNHLRDVVISLKPNGKDPFIATKTSTQLKEN